LLHRIRGQAVPIGHGQTISQPFIVALMTQLAEVAPDHVVLEVGTGSGYQAAILAHLARKVCTIEIIPQLAEAAAKTLRDLAYDNVSVRLGDGYGGWPECGPFDAIVVTAALGEPPPPLIEQLKVGGRLVMPVGPAYTTQQLTVVEKIAPGKTTTRAVALVPLCALYAFTRTKSRLTVRVPCRSTTWGLPGWLEPCGNARFGARFMATALS
jgi:protein-L-isoaspartate(D-aspartate) O-methyltransferase